MIDRDIDETAANLHTAKPDFLSMRRILAEFVAGIRDKLAVQFLEEYIRVACFECRTAERGEVPALLKRGGCYWHPATDGLAQRGVSNETLCMASELRVHAEKMAPVLNAGAEIL